MQKDVASRFTALTFAIALAAWGICTVFGFFGLIAENAPWLYVFVAFCAFSPTIASYVVLKKHGEVSGLTEWLKNVFSIKAPALCYLFVLALLAVAFVPKILLTGWVDVAPLYTVFALLPVTLIFGGIEEAGWSYVLRPRWEKKFGFALSSLLVAFVWAAWHVPVFLPQGRIESLAWFGVFAIGCLGDSFALGAIMKITKNVFLCVLYHTLCNTVSGMLHGYSEALVATALSTGLLIVVSTAVVRLYANRK